MVWFMLHFGKSILQALIKSPIYLQWTESWVWILFICFHFFLEIGF